MKTLNNLLLSAWLLAAVSFAPSTFARAASGAASGGNAAGPAAPAAMAATGDMTGAEVRKVDKEAKTITLKHGDLKNLGMPAMTMVFQVKDPSVLETLKAGDKVRFKAEKAGAALVVTDIEFAQ